MVCFRIQELCPRIPRVIHVGSGGHVWACVLALGVPGVGERDDRSERGRGGQCS